ncbi:tRNA threonylcarbamoyladenosine biosynthesis protein TsaE [Cognatiyoonia koreensis]|uniref:tRNA threonylcarbamoyladenosine biosynthesis protein TsaE n=1 Tax=Cognatiyoonia koreensis TaxID=364200 RepID=A0A1I0RPY1_9RHOB|nr:tRNA (adenosine(37)-N6)-threonylcarbamoyltransferase complex ATPase subunit type 1 TsaE [Cognatiyoonia koreensis]SEW43342.1 tRNA threonylcarbamoyladenosine biosynthesis protein TsaE [Cognatiyoonia koreensis]
MLSDPFCLDLPTEDATRNLAGGLAPLLQVGDVLLLSGPVGAGKSFFCRALIRARTHTREDIPSPTFTLVQTYPHPDGDIWHCDLYRLSHPDDVLELGLEEAFSDAICLIEWPDRLGSLAPANALNLAFEATDTGHRVTIRGNAEWATRMNALHA